MVVVTSKDEESASLVSFCVDADSFTEAVMKGLEVIRTSIEPDSGRILKVIRMSDGREVEMEASRRSLV